MRREKKAIMKGLTAMGLAICISAMLCVTGQAMEPSARRNEDAVTAADSAGAGIMPMSANVRQLAELSISSGTIRRSNTGTEAEKERTTAFGEPAGYPGARTGSKQESQAIRGASRKP